MDGSINKSLRNGVCFALLSLLVLPGISLAQNYADPGVFQKTFDRKPVDYQAPGIHLGSFMLKPGADISYEKDDNVFYANNSSENNDDGIVHLRPWANLSSGWTRHALNLNAYADIAKYNDFDMLDYEDLVFTLDGRVDVKSQSNFNYKASAMQLHEDRSSPDDINGYTPTEFSYNGIGAGYDHTINRVTGSINYETIDSDYDNNVDGDGNIIDNQDRDRNRDSLTLRASYELSPERSIFLGFGTNQVDYKQKYDQGGFNRSSDGYNIQGGLSWLLTGILTGDLHANYFKQDYSDIRLNSISSVGLGGNLDWTPTQLTNVHLHFSNTPQETTQANTSGYNSALYSARVQHEFRRNILGSVGLSYTNNGYENNGNNPNALKETEVLKFGLSLSYLFNRNVSLTGGYSYGEQTSNLSAFEYTNNRWFLTLGLEL